MAAIGYHFGSREALLTTALIDAIDAWGTRLGRTLSAYGTDGASEAERYEALWAAVIQSFTDDRKLWLATLEGLVQAEHSDDLRRYLSGGQVQGRRGLAALLRGVPEDEIDDATARTLGAAQLALFTGLMTQWLTDPQQAPRAPDVVAGLRALTTLVAPGR
ncbi:TetR family transcriptional regulator [Streptomyces sp. SID14478]|uniref:TetR family transcriptional regulator C-terminal domain-containing protein n=1 Tax=Streptomyces sp. SID14478 TaxID=2706073 RepID=UPI0013D9BDD3|nr:TetR family transcriptional regulator C-terminal domain-containing protein [Streptomyces sp. SID14478]NEB75443.1 TetR family transcriptional regulator [Streptomyces sp. SID14478]